MLADVCLWLIEVEPPLLERLSPEQRSTVLASLAVVLVLLLVLVAMIAAGARIVRRMSRRSTGTSRMAADNWYDKPLVEHDLEASIDEDAE